MFEHRITSSTSALTSYESINVISCENIPYVINSDRIVTLYRINIFLTVSAFVYV